MLNQQNRCIDQGQKRQRTRAIVLGSELINQDSDARDVNSFGSNKEMGVILDEQFESQQAGNKTSHSQEHFNLDRLPSHPCEQFVYRRAPSPSPHHKVQHNSVTFG